MCVCDLYQVKKKKAFLVRKRERERISNGEQQAEGKVGSPLGKEPNAVLDLKSLACRCLTN